MAEYMAEYIAREAAIGRLDELEQTAHHNSVLWPDHVEECREALRDVPAADVRPVVRGKWQSWTQDRPPCKWYSCDYCGFHALSKSNYCPNCGACMEES